VTGLHSDSHTVSVPSPDRTIEFSWSHAADDVAGIAVRKEEPQLWAFVDAWLEKNRKSLLDTRAELRQIDERLAALPGLEETLQRFREAGLEWVESGCSMCVGMNGDVGQPGERIASTTNRNFKGRQGAGVRTHLMSPAMVAAAAIAGTLADCRPYLAGRKP
jgi:hypothetical protein